MEEIATIVQLAETHGLSPRSVHYVTMLTGSASQLFAYFEAALAYAHDHLPTMFWKRRFQSIALQKGGDAT